MNSLQETKEEREREREGEREGEGEGEGEGEREVRERGGSATRKKIGTCTAHIQSPTPLPACTDH